MWPVVRTDPPNEIIRPPRMISSSSGSSPAEGSLESLSHLWWKGAGDLHSCLIAVRQLDECELKYIFTVLAPFPFFFVPLV